MDGGGADRKWVYFMQQHCAPRNGQNSKRMHT